MNAPDELALLRAELAELRDEVRALRARELSPRFAAIYPAFEDRFRGTEADVRERLAVYLPEVRSCVRADAGGPRVLDLGPGRGEWLALLADAGVPARGVDDNGAMVEHLRGRGLDVGRGRRRLPPRRPPGRRAGRHHGVPRRRAPRPGVDARVAGPRRARAAAGRPAGAGDAAPGQPGDGRLQLLPRPHPPSPVPPARLEFLAAASGFTDVRLWELHPKEDVDLAGLRLTGVGAQDTALLAAALQKGLFGPQDYALLARTPE